MQYSSLTSAAASCIRMEERCELYKMTFSCCLISMQVTTNVHACIHVSTYIEHYLLLGEHLNCVPAGDVEIPCKTSNMCYSPWFANNHMKVITCHFVCRLSGTAKHTFLSSFKPALLFWMLWRVAILKTTFLGLQMTCMLLSALFSKL